MPSIYNYINYRDYLRDYFVEQKQFQKQMTHRAVLQMMGVSSTGFLSNVIAGKKNINREMGTKLGKIINLAPREQRYFTTMVAYTHAKSIEEKKKYLDRLFAQRKTTVAPLRSEQFSIFSKWYYVYIRDILCFYNFTDNYEALAAMLDPPIKSQEARDAILDLEKLGFITKDDDGCYRPAEALISTGDEAHSVQLANFQLATMDMAKRSLEKHAADKRDISFVSMTLSSESYLRVKSEVQDFRKKLLLIARDENQPDRVCQCNIQIFPVTALPGDDDE